MIRHLTHLLFCLSLALTLAVTGVAAAAARVSMEIDAARMTEVVICHGDSASLVTLDASGTPVPHPAKAHCANCPDCCQMAAAALPQAGRAEAAPSGLTSVAPLHPFAPAMLLLVPGHVQARAPPKDL